MLKTIKNMVRGSRGATRSAVTALLLLLMVCAAVPAAAWKDMGDDPLREMGYNPSGFRVVDGSFVMNVGEVQINITNWGLIGSTYSIARPWSSAPSCQWPAGSGNEYLWSAGLWVGGVVLGERLCSTGGLGSEWSPHDDIESTIYEAIAGKILRPSGNPTAGGNRAPSPGPDDDRDDLIDEEILNGFDDDGDGFIDEDFAQIGNQMFVLTNYDNTRLIQELFPDHSPMNLEVVQTSFQWENDQVDDFVGFDYKITNIGVTDVEKVYIGFFADSDIGPSGAGGTADDDMAGSWPRNTPGSPGLVRASDGSFVPLQVGYMFDNAESNPLDGYFGIVFLGHDVDPAGRFAPTTVGMRTFQSFSGQAAFDQGGDPTNDDERYQLLSAPVEEWDGDTQLGRQADFRFLVSAGPFEVMPPGGSLSFQVGMVVGSGLGTEDGGLGLLANAAEAALTWYGIYVNDIKTVITDGGLILDPGQMGRETLLCFDDFAGTGENPFDTFRPDYMDTSCLDPEWVLGQPSLSDDARFDIEIDGDVKNCAMFNMDNCFECARVLGHICGPEDFEDGGLWPCNDPDIPDSDKAGCTGIGGLETQIHWLVGMAPPPPGLRLWPSDSRVHVFWDDESMITKDIRLQEIDFESFRVWRADNWDRPFGTSLVNGPESSLWQMIAEFDLVNTYLTGGDTIPLGANTGFNEINYTPVSLSDPTFDGLAVAMQTLVDGDVENEHVRRPDVRTPEGVENEYFDLIGGWEMYPDVLDTFWAVTFRAADPATDPPTIEKHATDYFEYVDRAIHNGFIYFYSVTASDHQLLPAGNEAGIDLPVGAGLGGDPGSSFANTVPGTTAQTAEEREQFGVNIYVYPNPATLDALAEYQQLFPSGDDPTGVRITFTNLPAASNTVKVYTIAGDLVQEIPHNGLSGEGHVSWNLMSRNGQEIVSGVYLYTVQSDDDRFEDFIGKFVVIR